MPTPFADVYASLITALTGSLEVRALVALDNIVRLDTELEPLIDDRNVGDLPALILNPIPGGSGELYATSTRAEFIRVYELAYETDEEKLAATAGLFALDFAVQQALFQAGPTLGNRFVNAYEQSAWSPMTPTEVDQFQSQERGWRSAMTFTMQLFVNHDEMTGVS